MTAMRHIYSRIFLRDMGLILNGLSWEDGHYQYDYTKGIKKRCHYLNKKV